MVTGDHIDTAIAVAVRVGIINAEEKNLDGVALTGDLFRQRIGEYEKVWDAENQEWRLKFRSKNKFN
jgi:magnesium-transporting ATPase (P-type)